MSNKFDRRRKISTEGLNAFRFADHSDAAYLWWVAAAAYLFVRIFFGI